LCGYAQLAQAEVFGDHIVFAIALTAADEFQWRGPVIDGVPDFLVFFVTDAAIEKSIDAFELFLLRARGGIRERGLPVEHGTFGRRTILPPNKMAQGVEIPGAYRGEHADDQKKGVNISQAHCSSIEQQNLSVTIFFGIIVSFVA